MKKFLFYIILIFLFLFIQLGGAIFLKIYDIVPNFIIILIIFINLFYREYFKTNLFICFILGFILDIFSIFPFGFWMLVFVSFFGLNYILISYWINIENFLNFIFSIIFSVIIFEFVKWGILEGFHLFTNFYLIKFNILSILGRIFYNTLIVLLLYKPIDKMMLKFIEYENI